MAADLPRWRVLNQQARQAVQDHDYARLRELLLELKPLLPGNPRITYNLAAAEAKLGNRAAALAGLRNLAAMGLAFDIAGDDDFSSLRDAPEYGEAVRAIEAGRKPVTHAVKRFALAEPDLIPEDIAYDPKTRRFFVSSVRKSKILVLDEQGTAAREFAKTDLSVFALRVDAPRRLLWATTAFIGHCEACSAADDGKTFLQAYNLDSGALERRVESPQKGVLGDLTVSRGGAVYVSEGLHGSLFVLAPGGSRLERLDVPGELASPQTPALSADEKTLYVPDYLRGIAAIDLGTRALSWLRPSGDIAVNGIDGLYLNRGSFFAVQNGTAPPRLIRFSQDLQHQEILEANWAGLGDPTHGVVVGDEFSFIANSGWGEYDDAGHRKAGSQPVLSSVWTLKLRP